MKYLGLAILTIISGQAFAEENNFAFLDDTATEELVALNSVRALKLDPIFIQGSSLNYDFMERCNNFATIFTLLSTTEVIFIPKCVTHSWTEFTILNITAHVLKESVAPSVFAFKKVTPLYHKQCQEMVELLQKASTNEMALTGNCTLIKMPWYKHNYSELEASATLLN